MKRDWQIPIENKQPGLPGRRAVFLYCGRLHPQSGSHPFSLSNLAMTEGRQTA